MTLTSAQEPAEDITIPEQDGSLVAHERRRSRRVPLRWTLYLAFAGNGQRFRTKTRDISSDGFYCHLDRPARPGDEFECYIVLPTHSSQHPNDVVYLHCRARAVRVEEIAATADFGLACHIEDYSLAPLPLE